MAQENPRLAVRHKEAARMLGVSEKMLYLMVKAGRVRALKVGRMVLYAIADLEAFLARSQAQGGASDGVDRQ